MEQTKVASVQESTVTDTQGRVLERAGNAIVTVGDVVWTDGVIVYGHTTRGFQPFVQEVIPAGTIPLFGSMYNEFIHAVYDETKGEIVRYYEGKPFPLMVNSRNGFELIDISGGFSTDFDADMDESGNVYLISEGKWSYDYDGYTPERKGKKQLFNKTITKRITATYISEARPYDPDSNYTNTSVQTAVSYDSGYNTFELEEKSGKGETIKSTAFIWHNGKKVDDFSDTFKKASRDMFERLSLEFTGFYRDSVECSISRPRINGEGKTNYFLKVEMSGFVLIPFEFYEANITETIDKGKHGYDPVPSGIYIHGEEIWWISKYHGWEHSTVDDVDMVLAGKGQGLLQIVATEEYFVDENGDETLLTKSRKLASNRQNWNELTDWEEDGSIVFAGKMSYSYNETVYSSDEYWSRGDALAQFGLDRKESSQQTVELKYNTSRHHSYAEDIKSFRNSYEELEDRNKVKFMAQDGFRFDYDGNLYKGDTKIYSFKGDFEWVPKMVTEIEGGYLIGICDKYAGQGRPPLYRLIEVKGGRERDVDDEDVTWCNARLRPMANIEKWIRKGA